MRVEFYEVTFDLPSEWVDVTDDLPAGSPPTLARNDGVGSIQFSIAKYESGERPNINEERLQYLVRDFCERNHLGISDVVKFPARLPAATAVSASDIEFISVWYVSNGEDVALVTYTTVHSGDEKLQSEFEEATGIVRTLDF